MVRFFFETELILNSLFSMIVLQETESTQTFSCTPRIGVFDTIQIHNELENTSVNITSFTSVGVGYYINVTALFDLKEGFTYTLKLLNDSEVVFYDKLFCTNQNIENFSVNSNQYVTHATTNNFIVI